MIEELLPPNLKNSPQKKCRGMKRRLRKVFLDAHQFSPALEPTDWYDFWHYHADWRGYGNLGWGYRCKFLIALANVFRRFSTQCANFSTPYQLWICINQDDAGQDAVFFHTPNPNNDNFPVKFSAVNWGISAIEDYFSNLLPPYKFRAGSQEHEGSLVFFIFSRELGVPIEE